MPPALRPRRRSLLFATALLGPLALAGCEEEAAVVEESSDVPLTLTEMSVDTSLVPTLRSLASTHTLSAEGKRPLAVVAVCADGGGILVDVHRAGSIGSSSIPVDPLTIDVAVDSRGKRARVYADRSDGAGYRTSMWTSADLGTWEEIELDAAVNRAVSVAGDGILAAVPRRGRIDLWDVAEDGTATALTPISLPKGHIWELESVVRDGETVVVLATVLRSDAGRAPWTVRSADGGGTWEEPSALDSAGEWPSGYTLDRVGGRFVITGSAAFTHEEVDQGRTAMEGPTSWESEDGSAFTEVRITPPAFGLDGWTSPLRGSLSAGTPMDFVDLSTDGTVRSADGKRLHLTVHVDDDVRRMTRAEDGTWSGSGREDGAGVHIVHAVGDENGEIIVTSEEILGRTGEPRSIAGSQRIEPWRDLDAPNGPANGTLSGLLRWDSTSSVQSDDGLDVSSVSGAIGIAVDGNAITRQGELPEGAERWESTKVHPLGDSGPLISGLSVSDDGTRTLVGRVLVDGGWVEAEGLDVGDVLGIWWVSTIDGVHHLPLFRRAEAKWKEWHQPLVLVSEDGRSWEEMPEIERSLLPGEEAARGGRIITMVTVGEQLIGLGAVLGTDDYYRAATYVPEGGTWRVVPVEGAPAGSTIVHAAQVGGRMLAQQSWDGEYSPLDLAEDGTTSPVEDVPAGESRSIVMDLGDGALLTEGWVDELPDDEAAGDSPRGVGRCVWASRDAGEHWTPTLVPALHGDFAELSLQRDGDDVVVLGQRNHLPFGYRIVGAVQQVLGTAEG